MRYVIEFVCGNYLKHLEKYVTPCTIQEAKRFDSVASANKAIEAYPWIKHASGYPVPAATSTDGDKIECPKCSHANGDLWEHDFGGAEGETETECGECGVALSLSRRVTYTYTATEIGEG